MSENIDGWKCKEICATDRQWWKVTERHGLIYWRTCYELLQLFIERSLSFFFFLASLQRAEEEGETGYLLLLSGLLDQRPSESRTSLQLITTTELKHLTYNASCLFKTENRNTNLLVSINNYLFSSSCKFILCEKSEYHKKIFTNKASFPSHWMDGWMDYFKTKFAKNSVCFSTKPITACIALKRVRCMPLYLIHRCSPEIHMGLKWHEGE